jgi:hypothetical protein
MTLAASITRCSPEAAIYDFFNRQFQELESLLSSSKQTIASRSNRQWIAICDFNPAIESALGRVLASPLSRPESVPRGQREAFYRAQPPGGGFVMLIRPHSTSFAVRSFPARNAYSNSVTRKAKFETGIRSVDFAFRMSNFAAFTRGES